MELTVKRISDPSPVWNQIKNRILGDGQEIETKGDFIGVFDGEEMAAAFLLKYWSDHCYELHGGVAPKYWGRGKEICYDMGLKIFQSTPCLKIIAIIPEYNRLMRKCVQAAGLTLEGVIKRAHVKNMRAHDLYLYGITRGEGIKCHS